MLHGGPFLLSVFYNVFPNTISRYINNIFSANHNFLLQLEVPLLSFWEEIIKHFPNYTIT